MTALQFGRTDLMEWSGVIAGAAFVFYVKRSWPRGRRIGRAVMSGILGIIGTWGGVALLLHFWPGAPDEIRAVVGVIVTALFLPAVIWLEKGASSLEENPAAAWRFVGRLIASILRIERK